MRWPTSSVSALRPEQTDEKPGRPGDFPVFTVVVAVCGRADLLPRALTSVLKQTFQSFEVIVVDDGSQAWCAAIDPRIQFVQQSKGDGTAWNAGIARAAGRSICFLDSRDQFLPHHLSHALARLAQGPANACYAPMLVDRGDGGTYLRPPRAIGPGEHMADYLLRDRGTVPLSTLAVSTEMARRVLFTSHAAGEQELDFVLRLYLAGCTFDMLDEPGALCAERGATQTSLQNAALMGWLENLRAHIPPRAYYGFRGWTIAKSLAPTAPLQAFALYLAALARGSYRLKLAALVFMQVFIPETLYRRIAGLVIACTERGARRT